MDAACTIPKVGNLKYAPSATDACVAEIRPGEHVTVECEINCNEGLISATASKLPPDTVRFPFVNPATGPLRVVGAKSGQVLACGSMPWTLMPPAAPRSGATSASCRSSR